MSVATLAVEITDRLGEPRLIALTAWDDLTTDPAVVNTTRRNRAITDAVARIQRLAGIAEPTDTSLPAYAEFVELVVLGVEFYLLWYQSKTSAETKDAKDAFDEAAKDHRDRGWVTPVTDSVVDVSDEDQTSRRARFAPSVFDGYRITARGGGTDPDTDGTGE